MDQIERALSEAARGFPDELGRAWENTWEEALALLFMCLDEEAKAKVIIAVRALVDAWLDEAEDDDEVEEDGAS